MGANGARPYDPNRATPGAASQVRPSQGQVFQEQGAGVVIVVEVGMKYAVCVNKDTGKGRHMVKFGSLRPFSPPPLVPPMATPEPGKKPVAAKKTRPAMAELDKEFLSSNVE